VGGGARAGEGRLIGQFDGTLGPVQLRKVPEAHAAIAACADEKEGEKEGMRKKRRRAHGNGR
jgi:hypothetical protein